MTTTNWYLTLLKASQSITRLPDDVLKDIGSLSEELVAFFAQKSNSIKDFGEVIFTNPFTKIEEVVRVFAHPELNQTKGTVALFSPSQNGKTIHVFPNELRTMVPNRNINQADKISLYDAFKSALTQEFIKVVEPSKNMGMYRKPEEQLYYIKQTVNQIKSKLSSNRDASIDVVNWLRSGKIDGIMTPFAELIGVWAKDGVLDRFKNKLYNELVDDGFIAE